MSESLVIDWSDEDRSAEGKTVIWVQHLLAAVSLELVSMESFTNELDFVSAEWSGVLGDTVNS